MVKGLTMEKAVMENITVILNKPKYPGNIGSVARCAKNMGIRSIIVVNPATVDTETMA